MRFGESLTDTASNYGGHVLREMTNHTLCALEDAAWLDLRAGLVHETSPSQPVLEWLQDRIAQHEVHDACEARLNAFETRSQGDYVAIAETAGSWSAHRVLLHVRCADVLITVVARPTVVKMTDFASR